MDVEAGLDEGGRDAVSRARDLLWADLVLELGLATRQQVAESLRSRWVDPVGRSSPLPTLPGGNAERAQALVEQRLGELLASADGRPWRALLRRTRVGRAETRSIPGVATADADPTRAIEGVRTVSDERFTDFVIAGEGGMGVVYMAYDTDLRRFVALKMIRPPRVDGTPGPSPASPYDADPASLGAASAAHYGALVARFLQEAWITASLEHPGIVPIHELGRTPRGMPFYTMRFVNGDRTLADAIHDLRTGDLAARLALLEPFLKVCDAVDHAHARGVMHRDLKPGNIALGEHGEVIVLDWGLARFVDVPVAADPAGRHEVSVHRLESGDTTELAVIGTPGYMAPELARGERGAGDARADVFSLGAVLYEILTGRLPHGQRPWREWVTEGDPTATSDPCAVDALVPPGLGSIAAAALAWRPHDRPAHAGLLADGIRAWQAADARTREVERLEQGARSALEEARRGRGDQRIRGAQHAAVLIQEVARLRGLPAPEHPLRREVERLRARGVREQAWRALRWPLAIALAVAGAVAAVLWLAERARLRGLRAAADERLEVAERCVRTFSADAALREAEGAQLRAGEAAAGGALGPQEERAVHERLFRLVAAAHVQKGDVRGLALATARTLLEAPDRCLEPLSREAARALSRLGVFEAGGALLRQARSVTLEDRVCAAEAAGWTGDGAGYLAAWKGAPPALAEAAVQLARFAVLRTLPLENATDLCAIASGPDAVLLIATSDGGVHRWAAEDTAATRVPMRVSVFSGRLSPAARPGCVIVGGFDQEDPTRRRGVVYEVELASGQERLLWSGGSGPPRPHLLDVDGDDDPELVLTFAALSRGIEILDSDGRVWSQGRLGDLAALRVGEHPRVDVLDAATEHPLGAPPTLVLGTGGWDRGPLGYRLLRSHWDGSLGSLVRIQEPRIGVVASLCSCYSPPGEAAGLYFAHSYAPVTSYEPVLDDFLAHGPGIYVRDPLAGSLRPLRTAPRALYRSQEGGLASAGVHWRFTVGGEVAIGDGTRALASLWWVDAGERGTRGGLELRALGRAQAVAFVVPGVRLIDGRGGIAVGRLVSGVAGEQVAVSCTDHVVVVGRSPDVTGADGRPADDATAARGETQRQALIRALAAGLRGADHADASATVQALAARHPTWRGSATRVWCEVVASWLKAGRFDAARSALDEAARRGALSPPLRLCLEARLARASHRAEDAFGLYREAVLLLNALPQRGTTGVEAEAAPSLREEAYEALKRLAPLGPGLERRYALTGAWRPPAEWVGSRPGLATRAADGEGLECTLHGQREDSLGFDVEFKSAPRRLRAWARLLVRTQAYGSQLCLAVSQASSPDVREREGQEDDSAWITLSWTDSSSRGLGASYRASQAVDRRELAGRERPPWRKDRPLLLRIDFDSRLGQTEFLCRDEITGEELGRCAIPSSQGFRPGAYRVGLWATPKRTPWSDLTRVVLLEAGFEGECLRGCSILQPPEPPPEADLLQQELERLRNRPGERGAGAADVIRAVESRPESTSVDHRLARLIVGPHPVSLRELALACIEQRAGVLLELVGRDEDRPLVACDPELVVALAARALLDHAEHGDLLRAAREALGQAQLPVADGRPLPPPDDLSPAELLEAAARHSGPLQAVESYLSRLLRGESGGAWRRKALAACIRAAVARGLEESARTYLHQLLGGPDQELEGLKDDPVVRRLLGGEAR